MNLFKGLKKNSWLSKLNKIIDRPNVSKCVV